MNEEMSLADLAIGMSASVVSMPTGDSNLIRLKELGIMPNSKVVIVRGSALGGPVELDTKFGRFSIRQSDAKKIRVTVDS